MRSKVYLTNASARKNEMSVGTRIALLCVAFAIVAIYKVVFPWTPFWLDMCFIAFAILVSSLAPKSKNGKREGEDKSDRQ